MNLLKSLALRLRKDERGASLVEYSILIGIITVGAISAIGVVGGYVNTQWTTLSTTLVPPK